MSSKFKKDDRNVHRKDAACIGEGDRMYEPQSPYREPWPKHYGWENKLFGGGKVVFITTKRKLKFTLQFYGRSMVFFRYSGFLCQ
jgi:hypothetical protein